METTKQRQNKKQLFDRQMTMTTNVITQNNRAAGYVRKFNTFEYKIKHEKHEFKAKKLSCAYDL